MDVIHGIFRIHIVVLVDFQWYSNRKPGVKLIFVLSIGRYGPKNLKDQ